MSSKFSDIKALHYWSLLSNIFEEKRNFWVKSTERHRKPSTFSNFRILCGILYFLYFSIKNFLKQKFSIFIFSLQFLKNISKTNLSNPDQNSKIKPEFTCFYITLRHFFVFSKPFEVTQNISSQKSWFEKCYLHAKGFWLLLLDHSWPGYRLQFQFLVSLSVTYTVQVRDLVVPFCFNLRGWWSSVERPIYRQLNSAHLSPIMYKTYDTQHLLELLHIRSTYMSNELASH